VKTSVCGCPVCFAGSHPQPVIHPSRSSTPEPSRPAAASAPAASYSAPVATAGSASGLEGLAAFISANYMGMGKSAADALPELRRKGITASGNSYFMNGQRMDAAGIANALRLQVCPDSAHTCLKKSSCSTWYATKLVGMVPNQQALDVDKTQECACCRAVHKPYKLLSYSLFLLQVEFWL